VDTATAGEPPLFGPPAPQAPAYTQEQADEDAKALYDATEGGLTGWGTDEDAIWRTLEGKSKDQVDRIRQSYRDHYDNDLDQVLRDETSGKDREHVDALLKGKENQGEVDAVRIQAEMDGAFGGEEEVLKTLEKATPAERRQIAEAYAQKYGAPEGEDPQKFLLSRIEADGNFGAEQKERARNLIGVAGARSPEEARRLEAEAAAGRIKVAVDGWGTDENTVRDMLQGRFKQEIDDIAAAYERKYGHSLRDRLAEETDGAEQQEILSLFDAGKDGVKDPTAAAGQDAARLKQAVDGMGTDEDRIRGILAGKSGKEIDEIAAAYQERYGHSLRDRLADETGGAEQQEILSLFDAGKDGARDPRVALDRDAARIKQAVDGIGTDEDQIRGILEGKSKAEIDELARVYEQKYGHSLRGRLDDELDGREQVELVDQAFDRGKIDPDDPGANAERLRRLREQQQVEQGGGLWLTSKIQETIKGESDEQRLDRNVARAEAAAASGDQARAGQLLGFAEGDLESMVTSKNEAAEWAATGAAVVASTAVVIGTAGAAAPLVVAAGAAVAGAAAGGGAYAAVQGDAADPADIARQAAVGGVTGATAVVGGGGAIAARSALLGGAKQAALAGARDGVKAGAGGGCRRRRRPHGHRTRDLGERLGGRTSEGRHRHRPGRGCRGGPRRCHRGGHGRRPPGLGRTGRTNRRAGGCGRQRDPLAAATR
jgi:type III secretion translocon protein HrpF